MSRQALLICNDEELGRALGKACRARGLDVPGWCAARAEAVDASVLNAELFVVAADAGEGSGWPLARALAGRVPVIFIGTPDGPVSERLRAVPPRAGRAVEALLDVLGATPALLPSYENRLRVLGRELDRRGERLASLEELPDGFRVQPETDAPAIEYTGRELGGLARAALTSRGEPDWERPRGRLASAGQERLLRHLGSDLDQRGAARVRIVTLASSLAVSGYEADSPYDPERPFQELYRDAELRRLQQRARRRRREAEGWFSRLMDRLGVS